MDLGRTGNRVQIPNGTATVCVEAPHVAKAGHWGATLEKAVRRLRMRKSGYLLD